MNKVSSLKLSALLLLSGLLAACVSVEVPELDEATVPDQFQGPIEEQAEMWPDLSWWENFQTPELNELVTEVKANNLDLQNNRRNLESAQISLEEAGFNLFPVPLLTIGTGAVYTDSLGGAELNNSPAQPVNLNAGFTYNSILSKPASFEQAQALYDSNRALVADTALNTLGTTASTYFQVLFIRDQIQAAEQNLMNALEIGDITQARVDAGVAVPIDALQQQIAIQQQRTNIQSLQQIELSALSSLALLLGRSVQGFAVDGETLEVIDVPQLRPGIPAELLRRRPDLVQAEANLRINVANVELSRLSFFPNLSLTGNIGVSDASLSDLISSPDDLLNITASISQTLLDNGARARNSRLAEITMENSLNNYTRAALGAFNEIEVLLSNIRLLREQEVVAEQQLAQAEESFRLAEVRYREGVADFQTVLNAQNTLFAQRTAYLNNKIQRLNAMVGFYQALGGGWDADDESTMTIANE